MDLSKLSDEDLEALKSGDLSKVSDEGLAHLHEQAAESPRAQINSYAAPGAKNMPSGAVSPEEQQAEDNRNRALTIPTAVGAVGQMAYEHPGIAGAALSAPVTVPYALRMGQGAVNAATAYSNSRNAQALADLAHQARMGGNPIDPARLHEAYQNVASRMGGMAPPAAPATPPAPPPVGGQAGAEGANFLENTIGKFGALAQKYAPALNNPIINNPLTRGVVGVGAKVLGNPYVQGMTYSPEVNVGEQAELERRRKMGATITR